MGIVNRDGQPVLLPVDYIAEKRYYVRRANGMEPGGANAKENAMSYIVKITALDRKGTYLDCVGCAVSRRQAFEFSSREYAEDSLCMFTEPEEKARIVRI